MPSLELINNNIYNYFWFRLTQYYRKHFTDYSVNNTVLTIYRDQIAWQKESKDNIKQLANEMFNSCAYPQFANIAKMLKAPSIEYQLLLTVLDLCVQICRLYISAGETFAVKYFIIEVQKNLACAVNNCSTSL